jgi:hypothetical protein
MEAITAEEVDRAVVQTLREFLAISPEHARKVTAGLRHRHLLRMAVTKTPRPDVQYQPD